MSKRNLIIIFVGLFMACCTPSEQPIIIIINEQQPHLSLNGLMSSIVNTKSTIPFKAGSNMGIYVVEGVSNSITNANVSNSLMVALTDGKFAGDSIYLKEGCTYKLYAYSPWTENITDPRFVTFNHGTDFLLADDISLTSIKKGENSIGLIFYHKTAQVEFNLVDERDLQSKQLFPFSNASFEVSGFYKDCYLNLETGIISPGKIDKDIKITTQDTPFCFIPSVDIMKLNLSISIPGVNSGEQHFTGQISNQFICGRSYSYNILVKTTGVDIKASIVDWIPVEPGDIIITNI
jgi:hypothetical protein